MGSSGWPPVDTVAGRVVRRRPVAHAAVMGDSSGRPHDHGDAVARYQLRDILRYLQNWWEVMACRGRKCNDGLEEAAARA